MIQGSSQATFRMSYFMLLSAAIFNGWQLANAAPPLNFEAEPISYSDTTPATAITQLQADITAGTKSLATAGSQGYLAAVLDELDVPQSSQMLNFLKGSMQRPLIEPSNPRALYFGDDAYVGYVPGGIIELIVPDPQLGLVFYTLEEDAGKPIFQHQVARCMTCHSSSRTKNIPGLQVRSMLTDPTGQPVLSAGSYRTDHATPLRNRWGGWFVTGAHGETSHLGNMQLPDSKRPKQPIINSDGLNVINLSGLTDLSKSLTPHSDIVALMVFEHQIDAHNLMVRTNYAYQIDEQNGKHLAVDANWRSEARNLVRHLLFAAEASLEHPIQGTSSFADEFAKRGPFDSKGRSLRQFDLQTRLFKYPCSYTIHSSMFCELPEPIRMHVLNLLLDALESRAGSEWDELLVRLSPEERSTIAEILREVVR